MLFSTELWPLSVKVGTGTLELSVTDISWKNKVHTTASCRPGQSSVASFPRRLSCNSSACRSAISLSKSQIFLHHLDCPKLYADLLVSLCSRTGGRLLICGDLTCRARTLLISTNDLPPCSTSTVTNNTWHSRRDTTLVSSHSDVTVCSIWSSRQLHSRRRWSPVSMYLTPMVRPTTISLSATYRWCCTSRRHLLHLPWH